MLTPTNIKEYIKEQYNIEASTNEFILSKPVAIKQSDFGGKNDCALSAITMLFYSLLNKKYTHTYIYPFVEQFAKKYFFTNTSGMPTIFIANVMQCLLNYFKIDKKSKQCIIKNVGFNWQKIVSILKSSQEPIVLYCSSDGFEYYEQHCVLIIGTMTCESTKFLVVYDNWSKEKRYIDFNKLGLFSSISYIN